jgi:hypothetical protein
MLSEEKDILVCKEFTIKLGCRNYLFYYFVAETKTERFTSMALDEIGDWIKEKFKLSDEQLQDIGQVCSNNAAVAFSDFAMEYK